MTISLDDTVAEVKRYFRDNKWADSKLKAWVRDAVRDYSNRFPVVVETSSSATTSTYEYELAYLVLGVLEFEYPTGEDPPEFPEQRNHREPHFFDDGISYYDVVTYSGKNVAEIWLSDPLTGSSYNIKFLTEHKWTASGTDYTADVPDSVVTHALVQYVIWQCWRERLTIERETADAERLKMIAAEASNAAQNYTGYIEMIKSSRAAESQVVKWQMDKHDRIY